MAVHAARNYMFLVLMLLSGTLCARMPAADVLVMEKESVHFTVIYAANHDRYAHIVLQMAEEEYLNVAEYTGYQPVRPIIIRLVDHASSGNVFLQSKSIAGGIFTTSPENSFTVHVSADYIALREAVAQETAAHFIRQSFLYGDTHRQRLYPELLHDSSLFIRAYTDYIARGFTMNDSVILKQYLSATGRYTLPSYYSDEMIYRYTAFLSYLEEEYGRERLVRLFMLHLRGGNSLRHLEKIYGSRRETLLERCRLHYRTSYGLSASTGKGVAVRNPVYGTPAVTVSVEGNRATVSAYGQTRTHTVSVAGNQASRFSRPLSVSPDGLSYVYAQNEGDRSVIVVAESKTGKEISRIHFPFRRITTPSVSSDRSSLLFVGHTDTHADLYHYTVQDGEITRITDDHFLEMDPEFSPDGASVVYATNYNIQNDYDSIRFVIRQSSLADGAPVSRTVTQSFRTALHPRFDPDGTYVYCTVFLSDGYTIARVRPDTGDAETADRPGGDLFYPYPAGKQIRYTRLSGGKAHRLGSAGMPLSFVPVSAPDSATAGYPHDTLLDYSRIRTSTYHANEWKIRTDAALATDSGMNMHVKTDMSAEDGTGSHVITAGADHAYGIRSADEIGVSLGYTLHMGIFAAHTALSRLPLPAFPDRLQQGMVVDGRESLNSTTFHTASAAGYVQAGDSVMFGTGFSYDRYSYEHGPDDAAYAVPFVSVQYGIPSRSTLFSDGNMLYAQASYTAGDTRGIRTDISGSYGLLLPLGLYYAVQGNVSHIAGQMGGSHYTPLSLRGYPSGHLRPVSALKTTHELYWIPFDGITAGRIGSGPVGFGIFSDYAYVANALDRNDEGSVYSCGLLFRTGIPDKYFLKLDWLLPLIYGYTDETALLLSIGLKF